MQDTRLQELCNAYMRQELDFDAYRRQRTDYIDRLTDTPIAPDPLGAEHAPVQPDTRSPDGFRQNQLLWIGAIVAIIAMIALALIGH